MFLFLKKKKHKKKKKEEKEKEKETGPCYYWPDLSTWLLQPVEAITVRSISRARWLMAACSRPRLDKRPLSVVTGRGKPPAYICRVVRCRTGRDGTGGGGGVVEAAFPADSSLQTFFGGSPAPWSWSHTASWWRRQHSSAGLRRLWERQRGGLEKKNSPDHPALAKTCFSCSFFCFACSVKFFMFNLRLQLISDTGIGRLLSGSCLQLDRMRGSK